jgi:hypothetical protein
LAAKDRATFVHVFRTERRAIIRPRPYVATVQACTVEGPQFVDGAGFVTVEPQPDSPALPITRDLGQTWEQLPLPVGLGYPQITFFSPTQAVLVAGGT